MSFNSDRFAKLAGLAAPTASPAKAPSAAPAASPRVIREGAAPKNRESAEITQLRSIIRNEARAMIAEMRTPKGKKNLSEALTLGFAGPGFGGDKRIAFGAPMTSARSIASLFEMKEDDETQENNHPADESSDEVEETDETY